jgi:hypothetical protein
MKILFAIAAAGLLGLGTLSYTSAADTASGATPKECCSKSDSSCCKDKAECHKCCHSDKSCCTDKEACKSCCKGK